MLEDIKLYDASQSPIGILGYADARMDPKNVLLHNSTIAIDKTKFSQYVTNFTAKAYLECPSRTSALIGVGLAAIEILIKTDVPPNRKYNIQVIKGISTGLIKTIDKYIPISDLGFWMDYIAEMIYMYFIRRLSDVQDPINTASDFKKRERRILGKIIRDINALPDFNTARRSVMVGDIILHQSVLGMLFPLIKDTAEFGEAIRKLDLEALYVGYSFILDKDKIAKILKTEIEAKGNILELYSAPLEDDTDISHPVLKSTLNRRSDVGLDTFQNPFKATVDEAKELIKLLRYGSKESRFYIVLGMSEGLCDILLAQRNFDPYASEYSISKNVKRLVESYKLRGEIFLTFNDDDLYTHILSNVLERLDFYKKVVMIDLKGIIDTLCLETELGREARFAKLVGLNTNIYTSQLVMHYFTGYDYVMQRRHLIAKEDQNARSA